jgi:RHS repeat-associated protein
LSDALYQASSQGHFAMASSSKAVLCRYHYDPLDRVAATSALGQPEGLRFYQQNRLTTEIHGAVRRAIVQHEDLLLAQQQRIDSAIETTLLTTDQQRSVMHLLDNTEADSLAYTPYGHHPADSGLISLLGYNGEHRDPITGHYLLGNGYRAFNPVLMRFNSPDSLSPFGEGGINAYAYCKGDPVNRLDPTGHSAGWALIRNNLARIVASGRSGAHTTATFAGIPSIKRGRSQSFVNLRSPTTDFDTVKTLVGFHGSTRQNGTSLMRGLDPSFGGKSAGLSSGRGFYVGLDKAMAADFAEIAASNTAHVDPKIYPVYISHYSARMPGRDYRFGTMGEGGLGSRRLGDMELVIKEHLYRAVSIRDTEADTQLALPRASEAPF